MTDNVTVRPADGWVLVVPASARGLVHNAGPGLVQWHARGADEGEPPASMIGHPLPAGASVDWECRTSELYVRAVGRWEADVVTTPMPTQLAEDAQRPRLAIGGGVLVT